MALLDTYGDFNKRLGYGRVVTYSAEPVRYSNERLEPRTIYWKVTRRSKTRFSYFGMTEAAANACVRDMRDKFTRTYMRWGAILTEMPNDYPEVTADINHIVECGTGIEMTNPAGDNHSVEVDVDEVDEIITKTEPKTADDFADLFQEAELRDGDGDLDGIAIGSANWNGVTSIDGLITVLFTYTIPNFDIAKLGVQVWTSDGWQTMPTVRKQGTLLTFAATTNVRLRLTYDSGRYVSRSYYSTGLETHQLVIDDVTFNVHAAATSGAYFHPYVNFGGVAEIVATVLCDEDIPNPGTISQGTNAYHVNSRIGTKNLSVEPHRIERLGYDSAVGKYRYVFYAQQVLPPEHQPFLGVAISVRPSGDLRFSESPIVTINQTDYIDIYEITATASGGNYIVKAKFHSNLTNFNPAEFAETASWCHFVAGQDQQTVDEVAVSYESFSDRYFEATVTVPSHYMSGGRGLLSLKGTNSQTGAAVESVWREVVAN